MQTSLHDHSLRADLIALRRHLHQFPEIGFEEFETSAHVRSWLEARGFAVHGPVAGTGFYVEIEGAFDGPLVGYRAELDALPVQDQKETPYASKIPGKAHLCGHDAHMSVAAGVAMNCRARRDELHGTVRVFFQPNEERTPSGAPRMMEAGILDGMDAAFAIHVDPTLPVGTFGLKVGAVTAASASFKVVLRSEHSGHSARPHETVDTVWLATQILSQYYQLAGRIHDARKAAVITACRFFAGEAYNVIPQEVEFGGTIRCLDREAMAQLTQEMTHVGHALGHLYHAEVLVDFSDRLPAVMNDAACVETMRQAVVERCGPQAVRELHLASMGGEDFAFYLEEIPGALLRVGTMNGPGTRHPLHHARFDLDEAAIPLTADLMTDVLIRHLRVRAGTVALR